MARLAFLLFVVLVGDTAVTKLLSPNQFYTTTLQLNGIEVPPTPDLTKIAEKQGVDVGVIKLAQHYFERSQRDGIPYASEMSRSADSMKMAQAYANHVQTRIVAAAKMASGLTAYLEKCAANYCAANKISLTPEMAVKVASTLKTATELDLAALLEHAQPVDQLPDLNHIPGSEHGGTVEPPAADQAVVHQAPVPRMADRDELPVSKQDLDEKRLGTLGAEPVEPPVPTPAAEARPSEPAPIHPPAAGSKEVDSKETDGEKDKGIRSWLNSPAAHSVRDGYDSALDWVKRNPMSATGLGAGAGGLLLGYTGARALSGNPEASTQARLAALERARAQG